MLIFRHFRWLTDTETQPTTVTNEVPDIVLYIVCRYIKYEYLTLYSLPNNSCNQRCIEYHVHKYLRFSFILTNECQLYCMHKPRRPCNNQIVGFNNVHISLQQQRQPTVVHSSGNVDFATKCILMNIQVTF